MEASESLESLQARHRKEQRDLIARTTQKKKSATKKTRKGINDECDQLEQALKERQTREFATISGTGLGESVTEPEDSEGQDEGDETNGVEKAIEGLSITSPQPNGTTDFSDIQDGPKKKPNRAKARLARRAAEQEALVAQAKEEAADLPDQREIERTQMKAHFGKYGLQEREIRADGHCLYSAIADQIETRELGLKPKIKPKVGTEDPTLPAYKKVRYAAADFIEQNADDFAGFMEEPLDAYLQKIRNTGTWGGHLELQALARTYGVKINVLQADGRVEHIEAEGAGKDAKEIWLGYYRHNFGLGEHYNSLRKAP